MAAFSHLFGRSLSSRVLWLTIGIILLVELIILMPSMGRERELWLWARITQAHLAAFSVEAAAGHGGMDRQKTLSLLQLSGTESIKLLVPGQAPLMLAGVPWRADQMIDLGKEGLLASTGRADLELLGLGGHRLLVWAPSPLNRDIIVQVLVNGDDLASHLRFYVAHIAALSVVIALVTGLLVFAALDRLLVRPMQIMTASIVGFREDPEHAGMTDLDWLGKRRDDEIAGAARELAVMQSELRAALWRNARLAALGTAVAKISHDLRNILTSALLVADRLQEATDPAVKRAADTLIPAVERAAALVSRTVDFAREGPPAITRGQVALRGLVDEVAAGLEITVLNQVPEKVMLALDRAQIYRVLNNLFRNAAEAGATEVRVSVSADDGMTRMLVADNGPGLPQRVQQNLFRPFTSTGRYGGTGLGLAIARDLIRAHGGELALRQTGPHGTVFVMGLAVTDVLDP
jgi:signal transduction histidine kinase